MKVTVDPWRHILESLEPDLINLDYAVMHGPQIKPTLFKHSNKWQIVLEEFWPETIEWQGDSRKLDTAVEWTKRTLESWKNCRRESWDTWSFDTKKNAEKFITYYNIACPL